MEGDSTCRESFCWLLHSRLASITAALILCYFGLAPPYAPAWQGLSSPAVPVSPRISEWATLLGTSNLSGAGEPVLLCQVGLGACAGKRSPPRLNCPVSLRLFLLGGRGAWWLARGERSR